MERGWPGLVAEEAEGVGAPEEYAGNVDDGTRRRRASLRELASVEGRRVWAGEPAGVGTADGTGVLEEMGVALPPLLLLPPTPLLLVPSAPLIDSYASIVVWPVENDEQSATSSCCISVRSPLPPPRLEREPRAVDLLARRRVRAARELSDAELALPVPRKRD